MVNTLCVDTDGNGLGDSDADTNNDDEIQVAEAEVVTSLLIDAQNISSLQGIESFNNLEVISCGGNEFTSLELSQNPNLRSLTCINGQLTNLDVTQNPNIEYLACYGNQITALDVTQNPNLEYLACYGNQITALVVTQTPLLFQLRCQENQITNLDVTQNFNLEWLLCFNIQLISLDLAQHPNLLNISCFDNQLTSLNLKNGNNSNLTGLFAYDNPNLTCIQVDDENYANALDCDNDYWCKDEWAEYSEDCVLGLENNNYISFSMFPNPTQELLNIESKKLIQSVKIYSIQGQLIKEVFVSRVDVSSLTKGLYFAQVTIEGRTLSKKFIKF